MSGDDQVDEVEPWSVVLRQILPWLLPLCVLIAAVCGWPGPEVLS